MKLFAYFLEKFIGKHQYHDMIVLNYFAGVDFIKLIDNLTDFDSHHVRVFDSVNFFRQRLLNIRNLTTDKHVEVVSVSNVTDVFAQNRLLVVVKRTSVLVVEFFAQKLISKKTYILGLGLI